MGPSLVVAQMVKKLPAIQESWVQFLGWENPLEKEMATFSSILAEKSHGQTSLAGYCSWGHKESDTTEQLTHTHICNIMTSAYYDNFASSIQICIVFIYFCFLIAVARTSNAMLKRSGKSGYSCLVPDFITKAFSYSSLSIILAVALPWIAFIMLGYVPYAPTLVRVFIINGY